MTPPQLLHMTQPMDITTTPLYSIPLPQPATPAASNTINIGDIKIEIQSTGLTDRLIVKIIQVLYLINRNPHTALDKLQEELQAYIKLNINSPLKKTSTYCHRDIKTL